MLSQEGIITSPIPEEQDPGPCIWAGAARAPRAYHSLGCSLSMGQVIQVRDPRGEELQLHHELWRIHAPSIKSGPGNRGRSACGPTHVARLEFPRETGLILRCAGAVCGIAQSRT